MISKILHRRNIVHRKFRALSRKIKFPQNVVIRGEDAEYIIK